MSVLQGQVVFRSVRHLVVRIGDEDWVCEARGLLRHIEKASLVVGDRVEVEPDGERTGRVMSVLPRRNQLSRRREVGGGRELVVAANLDRVVAFFAARRPRLKFGTLDRLLIAAEHNGLAATIVVNKADLGFAAEIEGGLADYPPLGYPVLRVSVHSGEGVAEFRAMLGSGASVVSGPSGVGKSSMLSRVLGLELKTADVSEANEKGKHTTTAATWYALPGGGAVVDTPGFRDYGLWGLEPTDLARRMPDLAPWVQACKFRDCLHRGEPGCAVRSAADEGAISARRYRSYLGILDG